MSGAIWTEWITRPQDDGPDEFSLVCRDWAVTSEEARRAYASDEVLGMFLVYRKAHPGLDVQEAAIGSIRELLGRLLTDRAGCQCAAKPYAIVTDGSLYWIEDAP